MSVVISIGLDGKDIRTKDDIRNVISQATAYNSSYEDHINQFFKSLYDSSEDEFIKKTLTSIRRLKNTEEICRRLHVCADRYNARVKLYLELQERIKSKEENMDELLNEYYIKSKDELRPLKPVPIFAENVWIFRIKKPSGKISYEFVPRLMSIKINNVITIGSAKIIHMTYETATENRKENTFNENYEGILNVAIERCI